MIALISLNENYQILEFWYPLLRLKEAGYSVTIISPELKEYSSAENYPASPDMIISDIDPEKFDLLIVPGVKNHKKLKADDEIIKLIKEFNKNQNLIAAIGNGVESLIQADINLAELHPCDNEIISNSQVYTNKNIIIAKETKDLPSFMANILASLQKKK